MSTQKQTVTDSGNAPSVEKEGYRGVKWSDYWALAARLDDLLEASKLIANGPASAVKRGDWPVWDRFFAAIARAEGRAE